MHNKKAAIMVCLIAIVLSWRFTRFVKRFYSQALHWQTAVTYILSLECIFLASLWRQHAQNMNGHIKNCNFMAAVSFCCFKICIQQSGRKGGIAPWVLISHSWDLPGHCYLEGHFFTVINLPLHGRGKLPHVYKPLKTWELQWKQFLVWK